jgi:NitT/TauT family transport system substrate-binding protein
MKNKLGLLLTCLITPLTLASCNNDSNKITVAEVTRSIFYAPMYVALNEGYFEENGLEFERTNICAFQSKY